MNSVPALDSRVPHIVAAAHIVALLVFIGFVASTFHILLFPVIAYIIGRIRLWASLSTLTCGGFIFATILICAICMIKREFDESRTLIGIMLAGSVVTALMGWGHTRYDHAGILKVGSDATVEVLANRAPSKTDLRIILEMAYRHAEQENNGIIADEIPIHWDGVDYLVTVDADNNGHLLYASILDVTVLQTSFLK